MVATNTAPLLVHARHWLQRHPLWLLAGVALAVRILPATVRFVVGSDEGLFLTLGQNLASGAGYTGDGVTIQIDFPPGYPLFAAAIYWLGGDLELPAKLNLLLFGSLLPLPVYWLTRQFGDDTVAFLAGLLTALLPALALSQGNFEAAAEQLYSLLLYAGWAALFWALTQRRAAGFGAAGLAIGAAHLVRWEGVIVGLLGAGIIGLTLFRPPSHSSRPQQLLALSVFLAGLGLFAGPYGLFLYRHTGSFVSPKAAITRLHGASLAANTEDPFAFEKSYSNYEAYLADPTHPPDPGSNRSALVQRYADNVLRELRLFFTSASLMTWLWIVPAAIGLWTMKRRHALYILVLFIPLAAIPASVVDPRYFLPPLPPAMILAAFGWSWLATRLPTLALRPAPARRLPLGKILLAVSLALFALASLAGPFLYPRPTEYRTAGLALRDHLPQDAHMLARKRQVPFYAGAVWEWLPFADLPGVLAYAEAHDADYLVLDEFTTPALRPQFAYLLDPANAPAELTPIYHDPAGGVLVYQIDR